MRFANSLTKAVGDLTDASGTLCGSCDPSGPSHSSGTTECKPHNLAMIVIQTQ